MDANCMLHGAPISQMMVHCLIQHQYGELDDTMLEYFITKGAVLAGEICTTHCDGSKFAYGLLDVPLEMNRVDCAKMLVGKGVDPISGGSPRGEEFDVVPLFQEYFDHGTNKFIKWVFSDYLRDLQHSKCDLREVANRIIKSIHYMNAHNRRWLSQRRSPAHAVLTSSNEEMIKLLVQSGKEENLDLLAEQSSNGRTALHIAAENGDDTSAKVLLQL